MTHHPPTLVRLYFFSWRLLNRLVGLLFSAFTGLWLGILDRDSLHAVDQLYYDGQALYRDPEYNCRGLFPWEQEMIERYFARSRRLLLFGAGGGREMIALGRLGYQVDGYECNPEFVHQANELLSQSGVPGMVRPHARDQFPEIDGIYEGLIFGWGSYMLIQGRERRVRFLQECAARLLPEAPVLLSFYNQEETRLNDGLVVRIGSAARRLLRREALEPGDSLAPNYVHYFSKEQIASEMKEAGFAIVHYSAHSYGHAVGMAAGPVVV